MAKAHKTKASKSTFMSDGGFAKLKEAFKEALAYERCEGKDLCVTRVAVPRHPKPMSKPR